jgi:hypothetical protein
MMLSKWFDIALAQPFHLANWKREQSSKAVAGLLSTLVASSPLESVFADDIRLRKTWP